MRQAVQGSFKTSQVDTMDPSFSVGSFLRLHRKLRGLSLSDIETLTKIPMRSLERLEAGAYDRMSDGFVRGFVRTVAEAIGLDSGEVVTRMLAEASPNISTPELRTSVMAILMTSGICFLFLVAIIAIVLGSRETPFHVTGEGRAVLVREDPVRQLAEEVGVSWQIPGAESQIGSVRSMSAVRQ